MASKAGVGDDLLIKIHLEELKGIVHRLDNELEAYELQINGSSGSTSAELPSIQALKKDQDLRKKQLKKLDLIRSIYYQKCSVGSEWIQPLEELIRLLLGAVIEREEEEDCAARAEQDLRRDAKKKKEELQEKASESGGGGPEVSWTGEFEGKSVDLEARGGESRTFEPEEWSEDDCLALQNEDFNCKQGSEAARTIMKKRKKMAPGAIEHAQAHLEIVEGLIKKMMKEINELYKILGELVVAKALEESSANAKIMVGDKDDPFTRNLLPDNIITTNIKKQEIDSMGPQIRAKIEELKGLIEQLDQKIDKVLVLLEQCDEKVELLKAKMEDSETHNSLSCASSIDTKELEQKIKELPVDSGKTEEKPQDPRVPAEGIVETQHDQLDGQESSREAMKSGLARLIKLKNELADYLISLVSELQKATLTSASLKAELEKNPENGLDDLNEKKYEVEDSKQGSPRKAREKTSPAKNGENVLMEMIEAGQTQKKELQDLKVKEGTAEASRRKILFLAEQFERTESAMSTLRMRSEVTFCSFEENIGKHELQVKDGEERVIKLRKSFDELKNRSYSC